MSTGNKVCLTVILMLLAVGLLLTGVGSSLQINQTNRNIAALEQTVATLEQRGEANEAIPAQELVVLECSDDLVPCIDHKSTLNAEGLAVNIIYRVTCCETTNLEEAE